MQKFEALITGEKVKEILKKNGLTQADLATLENVALRQGQIKATKGMKGLAAVCLLLLEKHPELLPEIWKMAGHPDKAQEAEKDA